MALERSVLRRAAAYVVLSSAFRRVLVERYGVRPWDVHVRTPGVALERFTPGDRARARARLGVDKKAFVAVCVRRLVPRMGIDVLLDAWERIHEALPAGSTLLLVGDGPLHDALSERAERSSLAGSVRLLGRLPEEHLVEAYRSADVAVVPTVALEGFGLVVPEAAACGTPSIVSDAGGLPELTSKLDRSLVVEAGDAAALARADRGGGAWAAAHARVGPALCRELLLAGGSPSATARCIAVWSRAKRDGRLRVVYLDHVARLSGGEIALMRLLPRLQAVDPHMILGEDGPLAGGSHRRASPSRSFQSPPPRAICAVTPCDLAPPRRWRRCETSPT